MRDAVAREIQAANARPWPDMVVATQNIYLTYHPADPGCEIVRDQRYGSDERHRLDVFPGPRAERRPVLIYVHGGGFVGGDKTLPGSPYYDNIGAWAVRNGFVGVTITYRLAPHAKYPAGGDDVGAAVAWVRANIATYGGDPDGIILMGQSAGGSHVATYAARPALQRDGIGVAGIVLMSGVYDFALSDPAPNLKAYLGDDPAAIAAANSVPGVVAAGVPVMFGISQFDPPQFHRQALALFTALAARDGLVPNLLYLPQHNHISQVAHLNADGIDDALLGLRLAEFIRLNATRALTAH
jgi:triacylglycerol lipase